MAKDLNDALNAAKKRRGVFSKTIIWESGVSKSQFYRIIRAQEAPSEETKARIADSLEIDIGQFDKLFQNSRSEQILENTQTLSETLPNERPTPKNNKGLLFSGVGVFLVAAAVLTTQLAKRTDVSPLEASVVVPADKTLFIKDVTIPDGTSVPVNTTFVKTWRVKNVGNVVWKDRYLKRMTPLSGLICSSPAMVPIPETHPGETIDISVTFKTPHLPGSCRTDWKTSDHRGNLYFPDMHGLFSIVTVVQD
jgi:hypothetical protein